ncbi:hypothetical protein ACFYM2_11425 [Streptomyces sp. NPDC006711]|uniref:hypothetical protein n=1 Tax=unclassified Streptomyces TaxID=2593676 RepID=UPI0033E9A343
MSDRRPEGPGDAGAPVPEPIPRDLPDQQAGAEGDPWEAADDAEGAEGTPRGDQPDPEIPDTDEAGTGRRGAPHSGSTRPDHPVPHESTG